MHVVCRRINYEPRQTPVLTRLQICMVGKQVKVWKLKNAGAAMSNALRWILVNEEGRLLADPLNCVKGALVSRPSLKHLFKGTIGDLISPRHVAVLHCMGTKTKRLPAGLRQPPVSRAVNLRRANRDTTATERKMSSDKSPCRHKAARQKIFRLVFHFFFKFFLL